MELNLFIEQLTNNPASVDFELTMAVIDEHYNFTPVSFINGTATNNAGENNGSCKIFSFAQLNKLDEKATLACFGRFYRDDVLNNPTGTDHANIRNFMEHGWGRVEFSAQALSEK